MLKLLALGAALFVVYNIVGSTDTIQGARAAEVLTVSAGFIGLIIVTLMRDA